jgi:hypothetical protein
MQNSSQNGEGRLILILTIVLLVIAILTWLSPFNPIGPSPLTNLGASTAGKQNIPSSAPGSSTSTPLTADAVLELLVRNPEERTLATARPIGAIGWVVETQKTGRDAKGNACCGQRITFHYPGYGSFDYWGGEQPVGDPCTTTMYSDPNSGDKNWRLTCTRETDMPNKWDGVSWYPQ